MDIAICIALDSRTLVCVLMPNDLVCFALCRVKRMTKMTENVANGILSGVIKVSGFFTSSVANTKVGRKFFSLLPGEIVLATLDGFSTSVIYIIETLIST